MKKKIVGRIREVLADCGGMEKPGEEPKKWVVGISGGADSVALLRGMLMAGARVIAVHCNFHLRGEESLRDEDFVRELCRREGVELEVYQFNEAGLPEKGSVEELCRNQRYGVFREVMKRSRAYAIVVAHNADDNAETFFLNLMRGCGLRGLAAMQECNGDIVRPLIDVTREEIIAFLEEIGQGYIVDSSNADVTYSRNFIRHEVMPLLKTRWAHALKSIGTTQRILAEEEELLNNIEIGSDILDFARARMGILYRWASFRGASASMIEEMKRAAREKKCGLRWILPHNGSEITTFRGGFEYSYAPNRIQSDDIQGGLPAEFELQYVEVSDFEASNDMLYLTENPAEHPYVWRRPRPGDTIRPLGMGGKSQKVAKIMKDAGLSATERKKQWLLENATTGDIIWLPRLRRSIRETIDVDGKERVKVYRVSYRLK